MKLDDIHKKNIYKVPDEYFDDLPGRIQKRISEKNTPRESFSFNWSLTTKIALPVAAMIAIILLVVLNPRENNSTNLSYEAMLENVSSESMISFLELEDITSDDIIHSIDVQQLDENFQDLEQSYIEIEEQIDDELLDAIINEYDLDIDNI